MINTTAEELAFMLLQGKKRTYKKFTEIYDPLVPTKYFRNLFFIGDTPYNKEDIEDMILNRKNAGKDFACFWLYKDNYHASSFSEGDDCFVEETVYMCSDFNSLKIKNSSSQCEIVSQENIEEFREYFYQGSVHFGEEYALDETNRTVKTILEDNRCRFYIIKVDGKVIGMVEAFINGTTVRIEDFEILDEYQRKGYGSAILSYALSMAKIDGCKDIILQADMKDTPRFMYEKMGFRYDRKVIFVRKSLK